MHLLTPVLLAGAISAQQPAEGSRQKGSLLFVASINHLGGASMPFLVDPRYQAELEEQGWSVGYCTLSELTWETLRRFNVAVLIQHPDVNRFCLQEAWERGRDLYRRFLEAGGGILLFADLHRHRVRPHLNRLLAEYDLTVLWAPVRESDPAKALELSHYSGMRAGVADLVEPGPLTAGVAEVLYPIHARMTVTFRAGEAWRAAVRASETADASTEEGEEGEGYDSAPPLVAWREVGPGRMAIFSTHSTCFTLNPYHFMWDEGRFITQGDAGRLLRNAYEWLAAPSSGGESLGGFEPSQQAQIFDISPRLAESPPGAMTRGPSGPAHPVIIGAQSSISDGQESVAALCEAARAAGYEGIVFTEDAETLEPDDWARLVAECEDATDAHFLAVAGVRFPGLDTGNEGIAFNLRKPWPEIPWRDTSFTTYVRIGVNNAWQANLACLSSSRCPMPLRNLGAVNSIPLFTIDGDRTDDATRLFEETSAEGWQLSPLVYRRVRAASEIPSPSDGPVTWVYSPRWGDEFSPGQDALMETAVSSGPVIERFEVTMPGPWEQPRDRVLSAAIGVHSAAPLKRVSLYFRQRLIRRYYPEGGRLEVTARHRSCESGSLWLRAEDEAGGIAWCRAVPSTLVSYRHFIGGDRMNGYWYPTEPTEPGTGAAKVAGRWVRILGSAYPGWGWGDRIAMYSASQQDRPLGLETGPPDGGVQEIRVAPRLQTTAGEPFLRSAPTRRIVLNSSDCVIMHDRIERLITTVTGEEGRHRRRVLPDERLEDAQAWLIGFRWSGAMSFLVRAEAMLADVVELAESDRANPSLFEVRLGDEADAYEYVRVLFEDGERVESDGPSLAPTTTHRAGCITFSPHPFGTPAVFFPTDSVLSVVSGGPHLNVGPDVSANGPERPRRAQGTYLFMLSSGPDHEDVVAETRDRFGFDGSPAWAAEVTGGVVEEGPLPVPLTAKAQDCGIVAHLSAADLPNPLPVQVQGMRERWDAAIVDLNEGRMTRHCGTWEGAAWLVVDVTRERRLFIGHPIAASDPDVIVSVASLDEAGAEVIVHNPTPEPRSVSLRTAPEIAELLQWQRDVDLAAGETRTLNVR
ncbi:MAG: hypothetical protein ACP5KN_00245 [Armatimonadota bacterium]